MDQISPVTFSAAEAAKYLGISGWLVLELVKRREIPAIRAGRRVLFRKETLDSWMQEQEEKSIQTIHSQVGKIRKVDA